MTMIKWRRLTITMVAIILLTTFAQAVMKAGLCSSNPRKVDVFTNKAPFDGKGINNPSDSFQPQELVELYASVTYNEWPVANVLVAFQIDNPKNAFWNITIVGAGATNNDGIASFHFRIPWPAENAEQIIFGTWFVVATVDIAGVVVMDTLTFQVGWTIKITNAGTLNSQLEPQIDFKREEKIVFDLIAENIALTAKNATIIIDVQDSANYPIMHIEETRNFQPGENRVKITSEIPTTAAVGRATASVAVYTAPPKYGGVPYSPPFLLQFNILLPIKYYLAIRTEPSGIAAIPGEGWYNEGTVVSLTAPNVVPILTGVRYKFSYWDVDGLPWTGNPITLIMDKNHTATAHYTLQYFLSVKTSPAGIAVIPGEGWYDACVNVSLSAPPVRGYDFSHWDVDGVSRPAGVYQIVVFMDGPHTATAHYGARWVEWLYLVLLVILISFIILLCVLVYRRIRRRRKASEEAFYRGWTAWYYGYDLRGKSRNFESYSFGRKR
ncbi:MAG: hypothetical protein QXR89_06890 [Candidatus Bathyarchaeia archaeon]